MRALSCLMLSLLLFGCASEQETNPPEDDDDPICEAWCEAVLEPNCSSMNFAGCVDDCIADREQEPECEAEYDALLVCQTEGGFICDGGIPRTIGDCGAELNTSNACRAAN